MNAGALETLGFFFLETNDRVLQPRDDRLFQLFLRALTVERIDRIAVFV
jgi:hypothetical protein